MDSLANFSYAELPKSTNLYSSAAFVHNNTHCVLAAAQKDLFVLKGGVRGSSPLRAAIPLSLAKLPQNCEIISVTAYNERMEPEEKRETTGRPIIAVTVVQSLLASSLAGVKCQLNVYGLNSPNGSSLDAICADCWSVELKFTPLCLQHTDLWMRPYFDLVLSGSDNFLHVFRRRAVGVRRTLKVGSAGSSPTGRNSANAHGSAFVEVTPDDRFYPFPHLLHLHSSVLAMHLQPVYSNSSDKAHAVVGCQDGRVVHAILKSEQRSGTDTEATITCLSSTDRYVDGPVSSVMVFSRSARSAVGHTSKTERVNRLLTAAQADGLDDSPPMLSLVVTGAAGFVVCYPILSEGLLGSGHTLPQADRFDSVICSCAADINMDGWNELIFGTYGRELLVYSWTQKHVPAERTDVSKGSPGTHGKPDQRQPRGLLHVGVDGNGDGADAAGDSERKGEPVGEYQLTWHKSLAHPVQALTLADVNADGLEELVVTTMYGVYGFVPHLKTATQGLQQRLQLLLDIEKLQEVLKQTVQDSNDNKAK